MNDKPKLEQLNWSWGHNQRKKHEKNKKWGNELKSEIHIRMKDEAMRQLEEMSETEDAPISTIARRIIMEGLERIRLCNIEKK